MAKIIALIEVELDIEGVYDFLQAAKIVRENVVNVNYKEDVKQVSISPTSSFDKE